MAECAFLHVNANYSWQWTVGICFLFLQDAAVVPEGRILSTLQVLLRSIFSIYNAGAAADLFRWQEDKMSDDLTRN